MKLKQFLLSDQIVEKFDKITNKNGYKYAQMLLLEIGKNEKLMNATPESVMHAALTAASLQLELYNGEAFVIPYTMKNGAIVAQFQIGWRGIYKLALQSNVYKLINVTDVREGEITDNNRLTGQLTFKWLPDEERESAKVVGYAAYFSTIYGFEKTLYMSKTSIENHAKTYSKSYARIDSPWVTNFDAMAKKTVLKLLLNNYGLKSKELATAITLDQSSTVGGKTIYVDNDEREVVHIHDIEIVEPEKEKEKEKEVKNIDGVDIIFPKNV